MDAQPARVNKSSEPPTEWTILLGYAIGVLAGYLVLWGVNAAAYGYSTSTWAERDLANLIAALILPLVWIITAIPFIVVRVLSGAGCFASPGRAVISGGVIAFLDLPLVIAAVLPFEIDVQSKLPPYSQQVIQAISSHWLVVTLAGATGGLVYWLVEFASLSRVLALYTDAHPLRWTGGWLSRRAAMAGATVLTLVALVAYVETIQRRWQPVIRQSSATPTVTFVREWHSTGRQTYFLAWSPDQTRLTSSTGKNLTVRSQAGVTLSVKPLPGISVVGAAINERYVAAPNEFFDKTATAFSVVDLDTGEFALREPDPTPGAPGIASAAVHLAMSSDGSRLAAGYQSPRSGQPVSIYDARTWRRVLTIDGSADQVLGTSAIALSPDGARVAFDKGSELNIANTQNGMVLLKIKGRPLALAFNAGGDLIAADMTTFTESHTSVSALKVYRVADGTEIASHNSVGHPVWDPMGRFIAFTIDWNHIGVWNLNLPPAPDTTMDVAPFSGPLAISPDGRCLAAATGDVISFFRIGVAQNQPRSRLVCDD